MEKKPVGLRLTDANRETLALIGGVKTLREILDLVASNLSAAPEQGGNTITLSDGDYEMAKKLANRRNETVDVAVGNIINAEWQAVFDDDPLAGI